MSMTDAPDPAPTLRDDEAALASYALQLADAFAAVAEQWFSRLVDSRQPGLASAAGAQERLADAATQLVTALRNLLALDIADQTIGPLELLRRGTALPTAVLAEAEVPRVPRDDFAVTHFPDDVYDLSPASFGDIDPSLHGPGLTWGAAKAHVHLRRRREPAIEREEQDQLVTEQRIVVLCADLMDRSKISAAFPDAVLVRSWSKLEEEAAAASLVVVDLGRLDDPAALSAITARVVAFGSHVNEDVLAAAQNAGAEALPRSVFFRRIETGEL